LRGMHAWCAVTTDVALPQGGSSSSVHEISPCLVARFTDPASLCRRMGASARKRRNGRRACDSVQHRPLDELQRDEPRRLGVAIRASPLAVPALAAPSGGAAPG
jgi:hypothetical protein